MREVVAPSPHARTLIVAALATFGLTAAHHVYGGWRYATPWRVHGAFAVVPICAAMLALFFTYRRGPATPVGRGAGWLLVIVATTLGVVAIGGFEGAYNHIAKNVLFLAGAPEGLLVWMFPPPTYELPNDAAFEISGVAQVLPAAVLALASYAFAGALRAPARAATSARIEPEAIVDRMDPETLSGARVPIPDPDALVHLQFRRFAGCPVCNLHLRSFALRHDELSAAGVREIVVFHTSAEELRLHAGDLPFAVVADPDKRLYAAFGVESAPGALLDPRAWWPILRAVVHAAIAIAQRRGRAPASRPHGGRFGLPADFLVASNGRVIACNYGAHVDDAWSVDEVLALARRT